MAQKEKFGISLMQIAHPVFCLFIVIILYFLENSGSFKRFADQLPFFPHIVRWVLLVILGIPAIMFYEKYRSERSFIKDEKSEHQLEIISTLNELLHEKEPAIEHHGKRTAEL